MCMFVTTYLKDTYTYLNHLVNLAHIESVTCLLKLKGNNCTTNIH